MPVRPKAPGRGEFAQQVADHVLGDEDGHVLLPVVDGDSVPDHLREHAGVPRPGLDHFLVLGLVHDRDLLHQRGLDVGALLGGPAHYFFLPGFFGRRRTIMPAVFLLRRVRYPSVGLPHGVCGWPPAPERPSPPPCGWSKGFIAMPRTDGRLPRHRLLPALPTFSFSCSTLPTCPITA